ncbi:MAG: CpaF family protein [Lachnospiraceae bacterium]|nr:CpaF family protein [Lachnospiraceae bacterium]
MWTYEQAKEKMRDQILRQIDYSKEISDEEIQELIESAVCDQKHLQIWPVKDRCRLAQEVFYSLRRWDILQKLLEDDKVTEIMVNGPEHIFVEREGKISRFEQSFSSKEQLQDVIRRMAAGCNRSVNQASPIVDARLEGGARVNIVLEPVAINGPVITIRRFPDKPIDMEQLIQYGSISEEAAEYLEVLVKSGYNILISGGTGCGKTTFLNALSHFIPEDQRVITIEDNAELQIQGVRNLIRLETRSTNLEGCQPISIRDLIRTALRMRPDRIIVGEVRGGEAADMMQCLNTGHDGSMSTGHANSARDMLSRLETMFLMGMELPLEAIRKQIASGIDIIVHLGRVRDKSRRVLEICEITGYQEGNIQMHTLFEFQEQQGSDCLQGTIIKKGDLKDDKKLQVAGLFLPCGKISPEDRVAVL